MTRQFRPAWTSASLAVESSVMGASKWRRGLRILAATLLGPGLMLVPLSLVALFDGSPDALAGFLGIGIIGMLICGIVSWPVAHLATKKLDRLTVFDIETFE